MKKTYIAPQIEVNIVEEFGILTGSEEIKIVTDPTKTTSSMLSNGLYFIEDDLGDEEEE